MQRLSRILVSPIEVPKNPFLFSLVFITCLVFLIYLKIYPRWETNDDVLMAMIASGFGTIDIATPKLYFSNVIWGGVIRLIPSLGGLMPYSLAILGSIFGGLISLLYFLLQLEVGWLVAVSTVLLVAFRPLLLPQFTLTAGLLAVTSIMGVLAFKRTSRTRLLSWSAVLFFLGYLIRKEEAFLVALAASGFFVRFKAPYLDKAQKSVICCLISALIFAESIDYFSYRGEEWRLFNQIQKSRGYFTDTARGSEIEKYPEVLEKFKFSVNDMRLFSNWFLGDLEISEPSRIKALAKDFNARITKVKFTEALDALRHFKKVTPLFYLATFLFSCFPSIRLASVWSITLLSVFYLGWTVGSERTRVIVPLLWLLIVLPIVSVQIKQKHLRLYLIIFSLVVAVFIEGSQNISTANFFAKRIKKLDEEISRIPNESIIIWGSALPVEDIYHPLNRDKRRNGLDLLNLGWATWFPGSKARSAFEQGMGIRDLLRRDSGVFMVAHNNDLSLLAGYCREHLKTNFVIYERKVFESFTINRVKCEIQPNQKVSHYGK